MPNITSTRERLLSFVSGKPDYEVITEPVYMPELQGWLVRTTIINHIGNGEIRNFHGASFRKIEEGSIYTALETAETVSLGRCLAKMGIGIEEEFASMDEMSDITVINPDVPIITTGITKVKNEKKDKIVTDTDHHDDAVAMKLAASNGDVKKVVEMIEEIKEVISETPGIIIPEREEIEISGKPVLKRDLKRRENKQLWEDLKAAGCNKDNLSKWMEEVGLTYKDHVEFIKLAPNVEIEEFYNYLKTQG
jgi:hypothetical protein